MDVSCWAVLGLFGMLFLPWISQSYFHGDYHYLYNTTISMWNMLVWHTWETLDLGHGLDKVLQMTRFLQETKFPIPSTIKHMCTSNCIGCQQIEVIWQCKLLHLLLERKTREMEGGWERPFSLLIFLNQPPQNCTIVTASTRNRSEPIRWGKYTEGY